MFWELYSRTYYFHSLPPGRMDKWFCLESCMGFSGFHVKDRYSTYRSCRSRVQAVLKFRPDGMVCLGVIRGKSDSQWLRWTMGVSCYQLLVSSKSSASPGVSQVALVVKNPPANAGDVRDAGSIPGLGISPGEGNGHPLQYSCLENPTDRGAWWATVHGLQRVGHDWVTEHMHTHTHTPPTINIHVEATDSYTAFCLLCSQTSAMQTPFGTSSVHTALSSPCHYHGL